MLERLHFAGRNVLLDCGLPRNDDMPRRRLSLTIFTGTSCPTIESRWNTGRTSICDAGIKAATPTSTIIRLWFVP